MLSRRNGRLVKYDVQKYDCQVCSISQSVISSYFTHCLSIGDFKILLITE